MGIGDLTAPPALSHTTIALFGETRADAAYGRTQAIRKALAMMDCGIVDATVAHRKPMAHRTPWEKIGLRIVELPIRWWRLFHNWRQLPSDSILFVPYPAFPDGLLAAILAKCSNRPLVMDALLGMHDTIVTDRRLIPRGSVISEWIAALEGWALRQCRVVFVDTPEHEAFFERAFEMGSSRVVALPLGIDAQKWAPVPMPKTSSPYKVTFWATGIPLHGASVVAQAARILSTSHPDIHITIIGMGPDDGTFRASLGPEIPDTVRWIRRWIPQSEIYRHAAASHCCLGIFGTTAKAGRVIPYKVQQALALGRPVITADTPAARRLLTHGRDAVLVTPGNPHALADAISWMADHPDAAGKIGANGHRCFISNLSESVLQQRLAEALGGIA